jgi:hypothetical protein
MVCRPATSEARARRPAGAINCIWTTYLGNYHNCSALLLSHFLFVINDFLFFIFVYQFFWFRNLGALPGNAGCFKKATKTPNAGHPICLDFFHHQVKFILARLSYAHHMLYQPNLSNFEFHIKKTKQLFLKIALNG